MTEKPTPTGPVQGRPGRMAARTAAKGPWAVAAYQEAVSGLNRRSEQTQAGSGSGWADPICGGTIAVRRFGLDPKPCAGPAFAKPAGWPIHNEIGPSQGRADGLAQSQAKQLAVRSATCLQSASAAQTRKHANTQTAQTRTKTLAKATWLEAKHQAKNGAKYRAAEVTTGER